MRSPHHACLCRGTLLWHYDLLSLDKHKVSNNQVSMGRSRTSSVCLPLEYKTDDGNNVSKTKFRSGALRLRF